jgi:hypothetical protein
MAGFLKHLVQRTTAASPLLTPRFAAPYGRVQRDVQPNGQPHFAESGSQPSQDPAWAASRRGARPEDEVFSQADPRALPARHAEPQAGPARQPPAAMSLRTTALVEDAALREQPRLLVDETAHAHVQTAVPVPPRKGHRKTAQLSLPARQPIDTAMPETALLAEPPQQQPGFAAQPGPHRQHQGRDAPSPDKTLEPEARAGEGQAATPSVAPQPATVEAHSATLPWPKQPSQQPSPKGVLLEPALPQPMGVQPMLAGDSSPQGPQQPAEASTVHVTIGRVELRAAAPAPAQPGARLAGGRPALSLSDYLARRSSGARR